MKGDRSEAQQGCADRQSSAAAAGARGQEPSAQGLLSLGCLPHHHHPEPAR